ncbi:hypothetical protein [Streptomyces sp. NPDC001750]|uniref:hypothetical protein n=1 Tax=Streptomyces sp. NPDC001750 TaxID=3364607 RepID=UPI0036CD68D1
MRTTAPANTRALAASRPRSSPSRRRTTEGRDPDGSGPSGLPGAGRLRQALSRARPRDLKG